MHRLIILFFGGIVLFSCQGKPKPPVTMLDPDLEQINAAILGDSLNPNLWFVKASLLQHKGYVAEATDAIRVAINLKPAPQYYHFLADLQLDHLQSREALQTMEQAAATFPDSVNTLLKLSEFQLILKQHDASIQTINKILAKNPAQAEAFFMLGMNFKEIKDTVRAINSFQTAVEQDAMLKDGWIELGHLFAAKAHPLASLYYENAIRLDTTDVQAWFAKAYYLQQIDSFSQARSIYERIILQDEKYLDAYFNLGLLFLAADSLDQAEHRFYQLTQLEIQNPRGYYYRGIVSKNKGDQAKAKEYFRQAANLDSKYKDALRQYEAL